ncbi:MAG: carboxymuconolactone decarboxylase family protein [Chloroflexota bacterium]
MNQRILYSKVAPGATQPLREMQTYLNSTDLEKPLLELVKVRASQINGCAYCIDMHTKDARALGETEQRLYTLSVWRETPFFTERERAALAWTECLTLISQTHDVPDALFDDVRQQFSEKELVDLTLAVNLINSWNRFAISFRSVPGSYQPSPKPHAEQVS